jgi:hypothetical protein
MGDSHTDATLDTYRCRHLSSNGHESSERSLRPMYGALVPTDRPTTSNDARPAAVSEREQFSLLRELRDTDEFGRLRRYLGRRRHSVSFGPRSTTVVRGRTKDGDQVDIAYAPVDIRDGAYDEAILVLGRTVDDQKLVVARVEYIEKERTITESSSASTARWDENHVGSKVVSTIGEAAAEAFTLEQ